MSSTRPICPLAFPPQPINPTRILSHLPLFSIWLKESLGINAPRLPSQCPDPARLTRDSHRRLRPPRSSLPRQCPRSLAGLRLATKTTFRPGRSSGWYHWARPPTTVRVSSPRSSVSLRSLSAPSTFSAALTSATRNCTLEKSSIEICSTCGASFFDGACRLGFSGLRLGEQNIRFRRYFRPGRGLAPSI